MWQFKFLISWHCRGFGFKCRKLEAFHFSQQNLHSSFVSHSLILSSCVAILSLILFFSSSLSHPRVFSFVLEAMAFDFQLWKPHTAHCWKSTHGWWRSFLGTVSWAGASFSEQGYDCVALMAASQQRRHLLSWRKVTQLSSKAKCNWLRKSQLPPAAL